MDPLLHACVNGDAAAVSALVAKGSDPNAICSVTNTTPLLEAVKNAGTGDHAACVRLLLEASADPDRVPGSGPTGEPPGDSALQHAAAEGYLDMVELLLQAGADVNACANLPDDDDDFYDQPPLSFACENAHPDVVSALLNHQADVNKRSTENRSPLELAAGSENAPDEALLEVVRQLIQAGASLDSFDDEENPLIRAAMAGHVLVTRELLAAGADPDWSKASNGETALYVACSEGHGAVVEELSAHCSEVNVRKTSTSETALYIACSKGHLDVVKVLLAAGVDAGEKQNTVPRTGYYPLYIAASNGHADVVDELQKAGCSISTLTTNKDTPLIIAAYNGYAKVIEVLSAANADVHYTKSGSGETALYYACLQGRLAAVKALLAANARHSDALFDNHETPLHCCAMGGHAQVVTELLKAGAKHGATKSDGATPLYSACHGGKLEAHDGQLQAVKELLRAGADPNASRPMEQGGDSCLIIAAFHQRTRMVEELLKAGADVEYANTDGMCALGWAVKKNVIAMVHALIEHGANPEFYNTAATSTPLIKAAMTAVTEGEPKAQQQAQDIVSVLLDAGASLNQSVAVARKHVPKAVKALQVVKMRRRRSSKTKGSPANSARTAEQLEEAELRAQQAMQELLAEEDLAQQQQQASNKKTKRKQAAQPQQSSKKSERPKSKGKPQQQASDHCVVNDKLAEDSGGGAVPKQWERLLEESDAESDAELRLLGSPVAAASEVGDDSTASATASVVTQEKSDHIEAYLFFCTSKTEQECLERGLLGNVEEALPAVSRIGASTRLYLLNSSTRMLFGEFRVVGGAGLNLVSDAWASKSGRNAKKCSPFPAQVRVKLQNGPSLGRKGVKLPLRSCPSAPGILGDVDIQRLLTVATAAAGTVYPSLSRKSTTISCTEMPPLVVPAVEVFRRRAMESSVHAMVKLFDGMCPERWQRMKPFTKRKFCQDLHNKWAFREAAWRCSSRTDPKTGLGSYVGDERNDPLLPSALAVRAETLRNWVLQQLKAEPYHLGDDTADGALYTLAELFARTCVRVSQFAYRCKQLLYRSRSKAAQQRRGRSSRSSVWNDAALNVTSTQDRKSRNAARSTIRLKWSDTQYPELGQESVELWESCYEDLMRRHTAHGHSSELARSRIFSMVLRHETSESKLGTTLALPPAAFELLSSQFDIKHECFASPVDCTHSSYCSLFPDTDVFFGSRGSFFDFEPTTGSFVVHTSPDLQVMQDACDHIVHLLSSSDEALSFCLMMPADRLVPITDLVGTEKTTLVRQCTVLPRGRHCLMSGLQHRPEGKGEQQVRAVVDKGDSQLYWLQNDSGASIWKVSDRATIALLNSFREQPSDSLDFSVADTDEALSTRNTSRNVKTKSETSSEENPANSKATAPVVAAKSPRASKSSRRSDEAQDTEPVDPPMHHGGIEELMETIGGKPLTVDLAFQDLDRPGEKRSLVGAVRADRQLLAWLDGLGLAKYAHLFVQAEVDMAAACLLSNKDLTDMQLPLGARRKLLHNISLFPENACGFFMSIGS